MNYQDSVTQLQGRFDDTFYAENFEAKLIPSTLLNEKSRFKFDSIIIDETPNIELSLEPNIASIFINSRKTN